MLSEPRPFTRTTSRAGAFTLIEVLIVIGILGLLTALAVIGFKVVGGSSRNRVTGVALANANGLTDTYKLTTSVDKLLDQATIDAVVTANRWEPPVSNPINSISACRACVPGVDPAGVKRTPANQAIYERYLRDETARVMRRIMASPENKKAIEAMSPDRIQRVKFPTPTGSPLSLPAPTGLPPEYATSVATADSVVLLDGSGQPIYFIPGGGLIRVNVGYKGTGDRVDPASYDQPNQTVVSPSRAPFWASPGPDGDLTTGDDNIYSFDAN